MAEEEVLVTIPKLGKLERASIEVVKGNPKVTSVVVRPITRVVKTVFEGRPYLWANGGKGVYVHYEWTGNTIEIETEAKYVYISYYTGSWKNTYESFAGLYDMEKKEFIMKIGKTEEVGRELFEEMKSKAIEEGFAISKSKAVSNAIAYYLYRLYRGQTREEDELRKALGELVRKYGLEKVKEVLESLE